MSPIITYLCRALIFHVSILFFRCVNSFTKYPSIGSAILQSAWILEGHFVFYIYSSGLIVKLLRKSPGDMTIDRHIYNLTELYGFYAGCWIASMIGGILSVYLYYAFSILSNALFMAHMWLQIQGYSDKPFLTIAMSNKCRLLLLALMMDSLSPIINRDIYMLYMLPIMSYGCQMVLMRYPLILEGEPWPGFVKLIWGSILEHVT